MSAAQDGSDGCYWSRFDALCKLVADVPPGRVQRARVLERLAQSRTAFECGEAVRMRKWIDARHLVPPVLVSTPDHFVDAWEEGYRCGSAILAGGER